MIQPHWLMQPARRHNLEVTPMPRKPGMGASRIERVYLLHNLAIAPIIRGFG